MLFSKVTEVAEALRNAKIDAWLIYDFRGINPLANSLLALPPDALSTRRLAACFTSSGRVRVLRHAIEQDSMPEAVGVAEDRIYLSKESLAEGIQWLLEGCSTIATEYSPEAANPYVSFVDAGTLELLKSCGAKTIVSSGDLIQSFQAVWTDAQWQSHKEAEAVTTSAFPKVWQFVASEVQSNGGVEESAVEALILDHFRDHQLLPGHPPIVARAAHAGMPHYETGSGQDTLIREGDVLLVDLWGRIDRPRTIYSDLTRMAYVGEEVPDRVAEVFDVVVRGRDAAIDLLKNRFGAGEEVFGWEVDRACRNVIEQSGFGKFFTHRTGHSIATELHGSGAHMDDLETHETRRVLPSTGFSIEPGIYMPVPEDGGFGCRSEVNVFISPDQTVHVTGGPLQTAVEPLLS